MKRKNQIFVSIDQCKAVWNIKHRLSFAALVLVYRANWDKLCFKRKSKFTHTLAHKCIYKPRLMSFWGLNCLERTRERSHSMNTVVNYSFVQFHKHIQNTACHCVSELVISFDAITIWCLVLIRQALCTKKTRTEFERTCFGLVSSIFKRIDYFVGAINLKCK